MQTRNADWKDVVATYFDRCLAITLLFIIFAFVVFPEIETRVVVASAKIQEIIEILPDMPEKIEQPQEVVKPIVNIEIIEDEPTDEKDDNVLVVDTIGETTVTVFDEVEPPPTVRIGETPRFVFFEDSPVIVRRVQPKYPEVMIKSRMTGTVTVDIEVLSDGTIGAIEIVRSLLPGPGGADEAAVNAVKQWEIQPAKSGGSPVSVWIRQSIQFQLER